MKLESEEAVGYDSLLCEVMLAGSKSMTSGVSFIEKPVLLNKTYLMDFFDLRALAEAFRRSSSLLPTLLLLHLHSPM